MAIPMFFSWAPASIPHQDNMLVVKADGSIEVIPEDSRDMGTISPVVAEQIARAILARVVKEK